MKHLIFNLLLIISSIQCLAQYEIGNTWNETKQSNVSIPELSPTKCNVLYELKEETQVCGNKYNVITSSIPDKKAKVIIDTFLIVEIDSAVFWRRADWPCEQRDLKIFDFSLDLRDTVEIDYVDLHWKADTFRVLTLPWIVSEINKDSLPNMKLIPSQAIDHLDNRFFTEEMNWFPTIGISDLGLFYSYRLSDWSHVWSCFNGQNLSPYYKISNCDTIFDASIVTAMDVEKDNLADIKSFYEITDFNLAIKSSQIFQISFHDFDGQFLFKKLNPILDDSYDLSHMKDKVVIIRLITNKGIFVAKRLLK